jgi:hypothetical protein
MMPPCVPLHHHDPAIRLTAAGFGGLFALWLWPRLDRPGNDSNARFASERQSFLPKPSKILTTPRIAPTVAQARTAGPRSRHRDRFLPVFQQSGLHRCFVSGLRANA